MEMGFTFLRATFIGREREESLNFTHQPLKEIRKEEMGSSRNSKEVLLKP